MSSRPTGTSRGRPGGSASKIVGRPPGSRAVVRNPAGLWKRNSRVASIAATGRPSKVTPSSELMTCAGVVSTVPWIATRPSVMKRSMSRREPTPARASSLAMRCGSMLARRGGGLGAGGAAVAARGIVGARPGGLVGGRGARGDRAVGADARALGPRHLDRPPAERVRRTARLGALAHRAVGLIGEAVGVARIGAQRRAAVGLADARRARTRGTVAGRAVDGRAAGRAAAGNAGRAGHRRVGGTCGARWQGRR